MQICCAMRILSLGNCWLVLHEVVSYYLGYEGGLNMAGWLSLIHTVLFVGLGHWRSISWSLSVDLWGLLLILIVDSVFNFVLGVSLVKRSCLIILNLTIFFLLFRLILQFIDEVSSDCFRRVLAYVGWLGTIFVWLVLLGKGRWYLLERCGDHEWARVYLLLRLVSAEGTHCFGGNLVVLFGHSIQVVSNILNSIQELLARARDITSVGVKSLGSGWGGDRLRFNCKLKGNISII